jgi:hypothetical protein
VVLFQELKETVHSTLISELVELFVEYLVVLTLLHVTLTLLLRMMTAHAASITVSQLLLTEVVSLEKWDGH